MTGGAPHVRASLTLLAGRGSGGSQAQHHQPRGASASHHQRRPPHTQRSPGTGTSSGSDQDGGRAQRAASTVSRAAGKAGSNPASSSRATVPGGMTQRRPSGRIRINQPAVSA